jgi:predicted ester cyclase
MTTTDEARDGKGKRGELVTRRAPSTGVPPALLADGRPMPGDYTISLFALGGTDRHLLHPSTERRQPMRGFEETYVDIVDYIVRITHRIWEEKDIGYIYDTYRHNARVHDDVGLQYGRDKIVADTVHTISAFPDVRIYADEVIWAGDENVGFYTSHRGTIVGHNTGYSRYGPPTGKKITVWAIANCSSLENEIFEEWVLYNTASMLRQLGYDVKALARELGNRLEPNPLAEGGFGEAERLPGQNKPPHSPPHSGEVPAIEDFIRRAYHTIWNRRSFSRIDDAYAATLRFHGPTDRELYGRGAYKAFLLSLISMFPDLAFQIDDLYWMGNEREGYQVALRWSAVGTHRGYGPYGPPTGRRVVLWGITQDTVKGGRIVEEWMLFNEFHLLQLLLRDDPLPAV